MSEEIKYYKIETSDNKGSSCIVQVQNDVITDLVETTNRSKADIAKGYSHFSSYPSNLSEFEQSFDDDLSHSSFGSEIEDAPYCKKTELSKKEFEEIKNAHFINDKIRDIHEKRAKLKAENKDPLESKRAKLLGEVLEYSSKDDEAPALVADSVKERIEPTQEGKRLSREEIQQEHDKQASLRFKNLKRYYEEIKQNG